MNMASVTRRGAGGHHAEAHAGEDVGVVALAGHVGFAVAGHGGERTAAGENRAAFGPGVGLLGGAFGLGGGIGQRKDDGRWL